MSSTGGKQTRRIDLHPSRQPLLAAGTVLGSHAPMLAHITPLEAPLLWVAFAAGIAVGALATALLMRRRATQRD